MRFVLLCAVCVYAVLVVVVGAAEKEPVAVAAKSPQYAPPVAILAQSHHHEPEGAFQWSYESADGSKQEQVGEVRVVDKEAVGVAQGAFSYTADDGQVYSVKYIADENGYQPQGDHLPVAPEVPPLIAKSLLYLATAPPQTDENKHYPGAINPSNIKKP